MTDERRARGNLVDLVGSGIREGGSALGTVPTLLKRLLAEDGWREFTTKLGEDVHYERLADFVDAAPLAGLGASADLVLRLTADDPELHEDLRDKLGLGQGRRTDLVDNINEVLRPDGTSEGAALRRLRKDRPDLHADVLAERLSAHAAMVEAGFRPRTISVPVQRPETIARALRKHMSADDLARLAALLTRDGVD